MAADSRQTRAGGRRRRTHVDRLVERLGLVKGGLPDGAVHDEDDMLRVDGGRHLPHLLEQRLLLLVPPRRVDNDQVPAGEGWVGEAGQGRWVR